MIASPPRKVGVMKCKACRYHRQRCTPTDPAITERTWIKGGQQDKCARCTKHGQPCGPPEYPPPTEQADSQSPTALSRKRRVSEVTQHIGEEHDMILAHNALGMVGPSGVMSDDMVALQHRLKEIDLRLEALSKLDEDILSVNLTDGDPENQTRFNTLFEARKATLDKVLDMLRLTKNLAIGVEEAGNAIDAYNAYTRVLEGYRTLNMPASYEIRSLLIKMAKLLWAMGDNYRAQSLAWQALESRDPLDRAQRSDLDVLKGIAKSLLQTSPELSQIIQSEMTGQLTACNSLLPPVHAMMESSYARNVPGNVFQPGLHPDINNGKAPESPIVGGIDAVVELLQEFSDADLEARDFNKRSPLLLAASRCKEGLGHGLMIRAKHNSRLSNRLVNARDGSGRTMLSVAISSGCSLPFVTALIDHGAEVDPDVVEQAMNPLQAACFVGSLDIVDLLVGRGASIDTAYPGSSSPYAIAQEQGHFDIVNRLSYSSSGSLSTHTAQKSDYGG